MADGEVPAIQIPVTVDTSKFDARLKAIEAQVKKFGNTQKNVIQKDGGNAFAALAGRAKMLAAPLAAAVVGFVSLQTAIAAIAKADNLNRVSAGLDITVESLQRLQYVADISGSSADTMTSVLEKMTMTMESMKDPASQVSLALGRIGLSSFDIATLKPDRAFIEIADALSKVDDRATRSEAAMRIFGRQAKLLSGVIDGGAAGIRKFSAEADRMGAIVSQEVVNQVAELGDEFDRLGGVTSAAGMKMTAESAKGLGMVVKQTTGLVKDNIGWLSAVGGKISEVFGYASVTARATAEGLKAIGVAGAGVASGLVGATDTMRELFAEADKISQHSANILTQTEDLWEKSGEAASSAGRIRKSEEEQSLDRYIAAQDARAERLQAFYAQAEDRDVKYLEGLLTRDQLAHEMKKSIIEREEQLNDAMIAEADSKHQEFISTKKAREYSFIKGLQKSAEESIEISRWEADNKAVVDDAYIAGRMRELESFNNGRRQRDRDYWQDLVIRSKQADEILIFQAKYRAQEEEVVMKEKINQIRKAEEDAARSTRAMWEASWQGKMAVMEGAMSQTSNMLGNLSDAFDKTSRHGFEMWKKMATAQAIVDTIASAVAAFKGMVTAIPGPVGYAMGVAAAAAATASGFANVRKIQQTQFDGGGGSSGGGAYSSNSASSGEATQTSGGGGLTRTTNVNISMQGRLFDQNQVRSLIGAINEAASDGARLTINTSNVK